MTHHALAILVTVLGWWSLTGLLLLLDGRPARTFPATMAAASIVLAGALALLAETRLDTSVSAAYLSVAGGVLLWGWVETSFLLGFVTGPRRHACPAGCAGWRHFGHAVEAILYHELAILAGAATVVVIAWGRPNAFGADAYLLLWAMRTSAKLNLFLGVPNVGEQYLPAHLRYLASFFRRRRMNLLFPLSVTAPVPVVVLLVARAAAPAAAGFEGTGCTLLATLLGLGILEHWFLVLPLPSEALWRFGLKPVADEPDDAAWSCAGAVTLPAELARQAGPDTRRRRALTPLPLDPSRLHW
jgi:putative photosynthetic complex assembly protein 2